MTKEEAQKGQERPWEKLLRPMNAFVEHDPPHDSAARVKEEVKEVTLR